MAHRVTVRTVSGVIILGLIALVLAAPTVHALTVAPLKHTVTLDPGGQTTVPIFIVNDGDKAVRVQAQIEGFSVDPDTQNIQYNVPDAATAWIQADRTDISLAPGEHDQINYQLLVPADALPGAHYLTLFANEQASSQDQISFGTRVGTLLFLYVAGDIEEEIVTQEFRSARTWYTAHSASFFLRVKNTSNIHVIPQGTFTLTNWRGNEIVSSDINSAGDKILAGGEWARAFEDIRLPVTAIGKVRARIYVQYGLSHKVLSDEITVWYIPRWLYIVGGIAIVILLLAGIERVKNHKTRKHE
ncbi:MAG: hypothetical protein COU35_01470 [Candidatus Magasanikbacteria bacterium CG10_big_fil_rev_8_21_14_0_10_47_10]|uniref:Uncharacterized protein n=1 Tax=Candidatus Magasanikbacteria bacterium CG10_big_fil_rev_8_21_14_0_10_47_10 TaxID=1974652 RepID=A0A2H0TR32_9BACT|nr:MAG: hypothetical protein COU35_01470 [Candidatus Magasanikbacteria bacterium CG10_big_fil_rev_8_21_14_0_10_47_10]